MSNRVINRDGATERRKDYEKLGKVDADEALWEALKTLDAAGIDVGPKASVILANRENTRRKFPIS